MTEYVTPPRFSKSLDDYYERSVDTNGTSHPNTLIMCLKETSNTTLRQLVQESCNAGETEDSSHPPVGYNLMFIAIFLFFGTMIRIMTFTFKVPETVLLMVFGIVLAYFFKLIDCYSCNNFDLLLGVAKPENIDPHFLLIMILPILLFESAFDINQHLFLKTLQKNLLLAVPEFIIASSLTALAAWALLPAIQNFGSWPLAIMFGSLISATDPVAVVALLKEIGGSKSLGTLIEGEALINDGSAIVIFTTAKGMIEGINSFTGAHRSIDMLGRAAAVNSTSDGFLVF